MSEGKNGEKHVPPPGAHVEEKIVFLIRHAESKSNSSSTDLKGAMGRVKRYFGSLFMFFFRGLMWVRNCGGGRGIKF